MAMSIENLKNGKVEKVSMLDVKVIKKVADDYYIVADETDHALLVSDQSLKEGCAYKLIKPSFGDSELRKKTKYGAVKVERNVKTKVLKKEEEKVLVASIKHVEKKVVNKVVNDFGLVDALGVGGTTQEIVLMVVNISGIIAGKFGTYRIITCKDIKNQKNSVNLYRNRHDMFTKLKVNNFFKDYQEFHRLGTTYAYRIIKSSRTG